jgi:uncharacterized protein (TIGR03083 family)
MESAMRAADLPATARAYAAEVALAQRTALVRQLEQLEPEQWLVVTECHPWRVRDIAAHIAGELVYARNPLAYLGLVATWLRRFRGRSFLDGTNEAALWARRDWTTAQLIDALGRDAPLAVPPAWARPLPLAGVAQLPRDATFGYLTDIVLPRDCWMHRRDIARAVGTPEEPDASDSEVVAQVVRDLGRGWNGPDAVLRLTGPGGGSWLLGAAPGRDTSDVVAEIDATEFLRLLSGRRTDPRLLDSVPQPLADQLAAARVTF